MWIAALRVLQRSDPRPRVAICYLTYHSTAMPPPRGCLRRDSLDLTPTATAAPTIAATRAPPRQRRRCRSRGSSTRRHRPHPCVIPSYPLHSLDLVDGVRRARALGLRVLRDRVVRVQDFVGCESSNP